MAWTPPQLEALAGRVRDEETAKVVFLDLLGWFGASRAGARALTTISDALERRDLATDPPLEGAPLDASITLRRRVVSAQEPLDGDGASKPRLRYAGFRVGGGWRRGWRRVSDPTSIKRLLVDTARIDL